MHAKHRVAAEAGNTRLLLLHCIVNHIKSREALPEDRLVQHDALHLLAYLTSHRAGLSTLVALN